MIRLSDSTLPSLSRRLATPGYDRGRLQPSMVHIGVGGFHRAHQAVYLDDLARCGSTDWGLVGVGLRSPAMRSALVPQDGLFTVVEQDSAGETARVVGAMTDYLFAPDDPRALLARLADPRTRIVSLTITGDGYNVGSSGTFRRGVPEVLRDLRRPETPSTWFGFLTQALVMRRKAGLGGFTVLSCDNLADSGGVAREALVSFAGLRDETLARWIERNVSFPHSLVDRITPRSGVEVQQLVRRRFGLEDRAPVLTEPFSQWVVEDSFSHGRPPWEDVGVQVVVDVTPYKLVKTRLLNGTHTAMAYLGWLAGFRTTAEMVRDETMRAFLCQMMRTEIAPHLPHLPAMPTDAYVTNLLDRLGNESIADPLSRLCARGSTKVPSYLLPSLVERRRRGEPAPLLTLALAAWFRYLRGTDLSGRHVDITDAALDELQPLAVEGGRDPSPLLRALGRRSALEDDPQLCWDLSSALHDLERGADAAVRRYLARSAGAGPTTIPVVPRSGLSAPDLIS